MNSNVAHFTKWRDQPCDIWALTNGNEMAPLIVKSCPYNWEQRISHQDQWWLYDKSKPKDAWRTVPSSKWPDEVCVALAKRVLLGETNS